MPRPSLALLTLLACLLASVLTASPARALPVDDYADYEPATRCNPVAKPGTVALGRWIVGRYGGGFGGISRTCGGSRSEHHEGRAFDWSVDVRRPADQLRVRRLLTALFRTDSHGAPDALARRMGIMYVIWNDRIWSAWNGFTARPYLSASCRSVLRCSPTLRHRDHVHISITRGAGQGSTSWYAGRI